MTEEILLDFIKNRDPRYHANAYRFVLAALQFAQKKMGGRRHISGKELLGGIKDYAWAEFGSMALTVFNEWGLKNTRDFGNIVFNLVELEEIKKTDDDTIEEFDEVYEFADVFRAEAEPRPND